MAEVKQEDLEQQRLSWEPHIKDEPESPSHIKEEPQEFPFHIITVKTEEDQDEASALHLRDETKADPSDTEHSEDYSPERNPKNKGSFATIPPVGKPDDDRSFSCSDDRPFSCTECGKTFKCKSDLQRHESSVHRGERPHKCSFCDKSFSLKFNLISHLKIHTGEKPFVCSVCDKGFVRKSRLSEHQRSVHHICPVCSQRFAEKKGLNEHLQGHVEEGSLDPSAVSRETVKPFSCSECGDSFRNKADRQRHVSSVHRGEKPHECSVCGKSFALKCNLKDHMNTHTGEKPFACLFCGKGFTQSNSVKKHMRTHATDRPHCPLCHKYIQAKNLPQHLRLSHHCCPDCDEQFSDKNALEDHLRTHKDEVVGKEPFGCSGSQRSKAKGRSDTSEPQVHNKK